MVSIDDHMMKKSSRPYVRWWWFAGVIEKKAITEQIEWIVRSGFGGVEIAWVYPSNDESSRAPRLFSTQWRRYVQFARRECARLAIGCDLTFGTLWPFGGTFLPHEFASMRHDGPSPQRLNHSWELAHHREPGPIMNHLDRRALLFYDGVVGAALERTAGSVREERGTPAYFCDSWEVWTEGLWTHRFAERFSERYGYDITPWIDRLDAEPHRRYDYRSLIAHLATEEFYVAYAEVCHRRGALARVQAHGSPTDVLAAFASADIPESEALLFDPAFSEIPASAARLAGTPIVSCEAFTCMYGWTPRSQYAPRLGQEDPRDVRMLADALFVHGINQIVWHGMPYSTPERPQRFYASVHVGSDGALAAAIPELNRYMTAVSELLREGREPTDFAVYLPIEDRRMADTLPPALRRPGAKYHWELRYERFPSELDGYQPTWISAPFLAEARVVDPPRRLDSAVPRSGRGFIAGERYFAGLIVHASRWIDSGALDEILRLAQGGVNVWIVHPPRRPGTHSQSAAVAYARSVERLAALSAVRGGPLDRDRLRSLITPWLESTDPSRPLPPYRLRVLPERGELIVFAADPAVREIDYPMEYGAARRSTATRFQLVTHAPARTIEFALTIPAGGAAALRIDLHSAAARPVPLPSPQLP